MKLSAYSKSWFIYTIFYQFYQNTHYECWSFLPVYIDVVVDYFYIVLFSINFIDVDIIVSSITITIYYGFSSGV